MSSSDVAAASTCLLVALVVLSAAPASAGQCDAVAAACQTSLSSFSQSDVLPHVLAGTVCPWMRDVFWAEESGCAAANKCCCCDPAFVADTNEAIGTSLIAPYLGSECKASPIQCDSGIDCDACQGGLPCLGNPLALGNIDTAASSCEDTESGSSCADFACQAGHVKSGTATCMNGAWDVSNAKCLRPCATNPLFRHINTALTACEGTQHGEACAFECAAGYTPSAAAATCEDGVWAPGPVCKKIDWCLEKKAPRMRIRKRRIVKPPRTGWDRGNELNKIDGTWQHKFKILGDNDVVDKFPLDDKADYSPHRGVLTGGFRCSGPRIEYPYEMFEAEWHAWENWQTVYKPNQTALDDAWPKDEPPPPSPVDVCEKACMNISSWAQNTTTPHVTMNARGFSLNWIQMSREDVREMFPKSFARGNWISSKIHHLWRGRPRYGTPRCFCESGDSRLCPAVRDKREVIENEGLLSPIHYTRYDFDLQKMDGFMEPGKSLVSAVSVCSDIG